MSHFASCLFGHTRPSLSSPDTTQCPICNARREAARRKLGYPRTGPLPPDVSSFPTTFAVEKIDMQRRTAA